jgi:hypothetical protein
MSFDKYLTEIRVEQALVLLAQTDKQHAELEGELKRSEMALKQAKAHVFLQATGTVAEREAKSEASDEYKKAVNTWVENYKQFKLLHNQRQHEILVSQIWQTYSANRRKGSL